HLEQGLALLVGGGDVEEHDLVRPVRLVLLGQRGRVTDVTQGDEPGALDHAAAAHVQAGDDAPGQHSRTSSATRPLVLETASVSASAWRSAIPRALNPASTTWWRSRPRSTRRWSVARASKANERIQWS